MQGGLLALDTIFGSLHRGLKVTPSIPTLSLITNGKLFQALTEFRKKESFFDFLKVYSHWTKVFAATVTLL